MSLGIVFLSEVFGTGMLTLLGCGVVANVALKGTKGNNGGFLMVNLGWGIAVFCRCIRRRKVRCAPEPGRHAWPPGQRQGRVRPGRQPSMSRQRSPTSVANSSVPSSAPSSCWLAYKQHFDAEPLPASKLAVFSTGPAIRSYAWNLVTEIIGTFVLVFVILTFGGTPSGLGPAGRGPAGCRHRRLPRWSDRLRHQPGP